MGFMRLYEKSHDIGSSLPAQLPLDLLVDDTRPFGGPSSYLLFTSANIRQGMQLAGENSLGHAVFFSRVFSS